MKQTCGDAAFMAVNALVFQCQYTQNWSVFITHYITHEKRYIRVIDRLKNEEKTVSNYPSSKLLCSSLKESVEKRTFRDEFFSEMTTDGFRKIMGVNGTCPK